VQARLGSAGIWSNFDRLPGDEVVAFTRSAEAAGYDTFWTQETAGRDPFALLSHLAGRTERIGLAVGIAVITLLVGVVWLAARFVSRTRGDRAPAPRQPVTVGGGS